MDSKKRTEDGRKIRIRLEYDDGYTQDDHCSGDGARVLVAYLKRSRYILGDDAVDEARMKDISRKIRSGEYVGLPVYAYVHGGVALSTDRRYPFNDAWDSGQSGFAYIPKRRTGYGRVTKKRRAEVEGWCRSAVREMSSILGGDVWRVVAERLEYTGSGGEELWTAEDSISGYVGRDSAESEARSLADGYRADGWEVEADGI